MLSTTPRQAAEKAEFLLAEMADLRKELTALRQNLVAAEFNSVLDHTRPAGGVDVLTATIADADPDTLRQMLDRFRERHPSNGIAVLASIQDGRPIVLAAITDDLVKAACTPVNW